MYLGNLDYGDVIWKCRFGGFYFELVVMFFLNASCWGSLTFDYVDTS
jgi:hypothetical protein